MAVLLHGGSTSRDTNDSDAYLSYWIPFLLHDGYSVPLTNYRGSTGKGEAFALYSARGVGLTHLCSTRNGSLFPWRFCAAISLNGLTDTDTMALASDLGGSLETGTEEEMDVMATKMALMEMGRAQTGTMAAEMAFRNVAGRNTYPVTGDIGLAAVTATILQSLKRRGITRRCS